MRARVIVLFFIMNFCASAFAATPEKLIFAMDVIRHGDRTPIFVIPKAAYDWPQGLGQLTPTGMQQEYQLGVSARKKYVNDTPLLTSQYLANAVFVRSSDVDRTLMSAQSFLLGLYPLGSGPTLPVTSQPALPQAYQPIPIHTVPKANETILNALTDAPDFKALIKKYVYSTPAWKAKKASLQPKFAAWSQATGVTITDLYQLKSLGDTLLINEKYHLALPPGLSVEDAHEIINTARWVLVTAFKPRVIGRATGGALLKSIIQDVQAASLQQTPLKFKLISAHDSNLLSLMSAMGAPLPEPPPYASDLSILLYETGHQSYVVKVTFNDQPVVIPACGGNTCTLHQFVSLMNE